MADKIFINYRRDDSASHALAVAQYFETEFGKSNIFIDFERLREGLKYKLRQCKVMLAIIGPNWVDARDEKTGNRRIDDPEDWVRVEIERALARKIPVIPVLVAGATLPSKSELPQSLQPLLDHHSVTVTTRHGMAGLARDVADLTVRRPWSRIAAAASALILGGYVVAHACALILGSYLVAQFGAPASKNADAAEAAKGKAEAPPDPALRAGDQRQSSEGTQWHESANVWLELANPARESPRPTRRGGQRGAGSPRRPVCRLIH
jgi:TIR domain